MHSAFPYINRCACDLTLVSEQENGIGEGKAISYHGLPVLAHRDTPACSRHHRQGGLVSAPFVSITAYSMLCVGNVRSNMKLWDCWDLMGTDFSWCLWPISLLADLMFVWALFSSLVVSKSGWTALLESWTSERGTEETWGACVDCWCLFEKYPCKGNPRWTHILKSDLHPKLQKIFSCSGLLQISAYCNGRPILKITCCHGPQRQWRLYFSH